MNLIQTAKIDTKSRPPCCVCVLLAMTQYERRVQRPRAAAELRQFAVTSTELSLREGPNES